MAGKFLLKPPDAPKERLLRRKIGGTVYEVAIHFSHTSKEDFNGKIKRLIKREIAKKQKTTVERFGKI